MLNVRCCEEKTNFSVIWSPPFIHIFFSISMRKIIFHHLPLCCRESKTSLIEPRPFQNLTFSSTRATDTTATAGCRNNNNAPDSNNSESLEEVNEMPRKHPDGRVLFKQKLLSIPSTLFQSGSSSGHPSGGSGGVGTGSLPSSYENKTYGYPIGNINIW